MSATLSRSNTLYLPNEIIFLILKFISDIKTLVMIRASSTLLRQMVQDSTTLISTLDIKRSPLNYNTYFPFSRVTEIVGRVPITSKRQLKRLARSKVMKATIVFESMLNFSSVSNLSIFLRERRGQLKPNSQLDILFEDLCHIKNGWVYVYCLDHYLELQKLFPDHRLCIKIVSLTGKMKPLTGGDLVAARSLGS